METISEAKVAAFIRDEMLGLGVAPELLSDDVLFDEIAVDSLDLADITTRLNSHFNVQLPRTALFGTTISEVARHTVHMSSQAV